jgi:mobilome CxxCx(11)CxxC protein
MSIEPLSSPEIQLNRDASVKAVEAYGTARIFEKRAGLYRAFNKLRDALGIGVPAMVGAIFMAFTFAEKYTAYILMVAGVFAVTQLSLSILSIVYGWDERYSYSRESVADNNKIRNKLEVILSGTGTLANRQARMVELRHEIQARETQDEGQGLDSKEKCFGRRHGHAQYQKTCIICNKIPQIGKMKHSCCVQYRNVN